MKRELRLSDTRRPLRRVAVGKTDLMKKELRPELGGV